MYFTETDKDTNVLAAINFKSVVDSATLGSPNCFKVADLTESWIMCAENQVDADTWICAIKKALNISCDKAP